MITLSSTSALVLSWAGTDHLRGRAARAYLERLDLGEGRMLRDACDAVCPYYAEVIRNRKHGVLGLVGKALESSGSAPQVVIAGAGLDPLGVELAERYPGAAVFEIDRENMDLKRGLLDAAGEPAARVTLVTADVADAAGVRRDLIAAGWDLGRGTVLVMEGVSYYLAPEALRGFVGAVDPGYLVAEYLKPAAAIAAARADIPERVFELIARACGLSAIHRHDEAGLQRLTGFVARERHGLDALERSRTGGNRFFPAEESGWIEVSLLHRPWPKNGVGHPDA